eukprot:762961-Hanusia_phi.AAC.7
MLASSCSRVHLLSSSCATLIETVMPHQQVLLSVTWCRMIGSSVPLPTGRQMLTSMQPGMLPHCTSSAARQPG